MSSSYAKGKRSLGICDRCGCREKYLEMRFQVVNSVKTGLRVCRDCLDLDHPQLKLNRVRIDDPQALRYPRPDPYRYYVPCIAGIAIPGVSVVGTS